MYIESGIVFLNDTIRFCCLADTESVIAPLNGPYMDIDQFLNFRNRVLTEPLETCKGCALLRPSPERGQKLKLINLAHGDICNFKCDYCFTSRPGFTYTKPKFNITPILRQLHERGLITEGCTFCYASGEPALNPELNEFLQFSEEVGGYNFITSNCSCYNDAVARVLETERGELLCSVDAGTPETFFKVRGADLFHNVLENLRLYAAKGKTISKYIVYEPNCRSSEMIQYLRCMRDIGITRIHLTLNSYGAVKPEYIYSIALGKYLALCMGFHVYEADRILRNEFIALKDTTNEVLLKRHEEFFKILRTEFPDIAKTIEPVKLGGQAAVAAPGHIDVHPGLKAGALFTIEGWITNPDLKKVFPSVFIKIGNSYFKTKPVPRPDVVAAYNEPSYLNSGFSAFILSRFLPTGIHRVEIIGVSETGILYAAEHTVEICIYSCGV